MKTYILLLVLVVALLLISRMEAFSLPDPDRFVASLESVENRRMLASLLDRDALANMLMDEPEQSAFDYLISAGADPEGLLHVKLVKLDLTNDQYENDRANLEEEIAEGVGSRRIAYLRSDLDRVYKNLKEAEESVLTLLPIYIENRKRPGAKDKYRALSRGDLITALDFLTKTQNNALYESLVLVDNVHRRKFNYGLQRRYERIMRDLDAYWSERRQEVNESLDTTSIPSDVVKMIAMYYKN